MTVLDILAVLALTYVVYLLLDVILDDEKLDVVSAKFVKVDERKYQLKPGERASFMLMKIAIACLCIIMMIGVAYLFGDLCNA